MPHCEDVIDVMLLPAMMLPHTLMRHASATLAPCCAILLRHNAVCRRYDDFRDMP